MSGVPVGHRAVGLAWLPPSAEALLALAADPPDVRVLTRSPAILAHVLRFARPTTDAGHFAGIPQFLTQPSLCTNAAAFLDQTGTAPARTPDRVDRTAEVAATVAAELARQSGNCSPAAAFATAMLVPLGWYAVRAVEPAALETCLTDPGFVDDPEAVQRRHWGLSAASLARRLAARWRLPTWLTAAIGFLRLEAGDVVAAGAPDGLVRVVQDAVAAAEQTLGRLGLTDNRGRDDGRLSKTDVLALAESAAAKSATRTVEDREAPAWLLARLLRATAEARRASGAVWLSESESSVDRLAESLAELRADFQARVRDARLEGLAEFAAGASHEINNPLAVVRGHAQLLLAREEDPDRRRQLEAIIRQTRRVHDLLHGTLQFARPSGPTPVPVPISEWLVGIMNANRVEADAKEVTLTCDETRHDAEWGFFDPSQVRLALDHLIRNAVEAAQPGGWVQVSLRWQGEAVVVAVEDSGPGPTEADRDHLFDPFFSGRKAGRGRGLGLAIAWRLARINGGDVRYASSPGGPTRFVLVLPTCPAVGERKSA